MAVVITTKLKGAEELIRSLDRVKRVISSGISGSVGHKLGVDGLRIVRKLTPRQRSRQFRTGRTSRGFQPFYKQWELIEQISTSNTYRAIIKNRATTSNRGRIALASIEFGARPHRIPGVGASLPYRLRWRQGGVSKFAGRTLLELGGDVIETRISRRSKSRDVFAWSVNHPGNRSFHMVRDTKIQMSGVAEGLLIEFKQQIERTFGSLSVSVG